MTKKKQIRVRNFQPTQKEYKEKAALNFSVDKVPI